MENPSLARGTTAGSQNRGIGFGKGCSHGRNGWGWIVRPKSPGAFELISSRRAPDSVVADFDRTPWQDMLKETFEELVSRKCDVADYLCAIVAVAERDLAVVEGFQPAVGDGDAEDVTAQIVEDLFTTSRRFRVNDPFFLPEG